MQTIVIRFIFPLFLFCWLIESSWNCVFSTIRFSRQKIFFFSSCESIHSNIYRLQCLWTKFYSRFCLGNCVTTPYVLLHDWLAIRHRLNAIYNRSICFARNFYCNLFLLLDGSFDHFFILLLPSVCLLSKQQTKQKQKKKRLYNQTEQWFCNKLFAIY